MTRRSRNRIERRLNPSPDPKHVSQLDATGKARAQQTIQDCLLAIVASQPRPLKISLEDLNEYGAAYRLKIEIEDGSVILTSEKVSLVKTVAPPKLKA